MIARITSVSIQLDKIDEATRIYDENIFPAIKAAKGNLGAYLLTDRANGNSLSITFWDSAADGQAYDASGTYREQVAKISQFFSSAPTLTTYDVGSRG